MQRAYQNSRIYTQNKNLLILNSDLLTMKNQSELTVITKSKDLCSYMMTVTQKSPKQFRFTFVSRLQNLALSSIENLFRANDVFVSKTDIHSQKERLSYQRSAMTDLKLLGYIALLSMEQNHLVLGSI